MRISTVRGRRARLLAALALLPAAACSSGAGDGPSLTLADDPSATVFLAQSRLPDVFMDALYQGRVVRGADGCLRLEGGDRNTVVWPHGYSLENRGGALAVKDGSGRVVGWIGGSFRLGGGEVRTVDHIVLLSEQERARAAERCPGSYWVAAP